MIDSPFYEGDEQFGRHARSSEIGRESRLGDGVCRILDRLMCYANESNGSTRRVTMRARCAPADDLDYAALADAIEAADLGIVLLTKSGFILFANGIAHELMAHGDGLRASAGWFSLTDSALNGRLHALLRRDVSQASRQTLMIERGEGRQPLLARITPLDQSDRARPEDNAAAAVVIIDPERYAAASLEAFCQRYRLTAAESRILQQVIGGGGLVAAAARLGVSEATARTHMQRIFEKTGTSRQTQLLSTFFKSTMGMPAYGA